MLSKDAYIQRLSQCLDARGELEFLQRLSQEELSLLWSKVAHQTLKMGLASQRSA